VIANEPVSKGTIFDVRCSDPTLSARLLIWTRQKKSWVDTGSGSLPSVVIRQPLKVMVAELVPDALRDLIATVPVPEPMPQFRRAGGLSGIARTGLVTCLGWQTAASAWPDKAEVVQTQ
jgi:hypothetical protein